MEAMSGKSMGSALLERESNGLLIDAVREFSGAVATALVASEMLARDRSDADVFEGSAHCSCC